MTMSRVRYRAPQMTVAERRAASGRFLEVRRGRRSIRDLSTRAVPRELVVNAIRAAAEAEEREGYAHRMSPEWLEALAPLGTDHRDSATTSTMILLVP